MIRFAFILLMSLVLSSKAVALVKSDHSGEDSVQKGRLAYEKGDYGTALQIFTPLAQEGDLVAQLNLAKMYREGRGVSKNYKAAVKWFNLSAAQGNAVAQYHLGVAYSFGLGVVPDYEIALKWYLSLLNKVMLLLSIIYLCFIILGMECRKIKCTLTCGLT